MKARRNTQGTSGEASPEPQEKGTQGRPEPTKHSAKSNHLLLPPPDIQNYNLVPSNRILNYKWARDDLRIGQSSQSSNTSLAAPHHYSWLLLFLHCSRTGQSPSSRSFLGSQRSLTQGPEGPKQQNGCALTTKSHTTATNKAESQASNIFEGKKQQVEK